MHELIVRIFFHGLIALAPGDASGAMTAYAMKHGNHEAQLAFELTGRTTCPSSVCTEETHEPPDLSWCVCDLKGLDVSFKQATVGAGEAIADRSGRPTGMVAAANPGWLASLHKINAKPIRVDKSTVESVTVSSFGFNWTSVRSCHLDQVDTEKEPGVYKIYDFNFYTEAGSSSAHSQALAEYVAFEVHIPSGIVALALTSRADDKIVAAIDLDCDQRSCPDLLVNNLVPEDKYSDDGGKHFEAYYSLAPSEDIFFPQRNAVGLPVGNRQLHNCPDDPFRKRKDVANLRLEGKRSICANPGASGNSFDKLDCGIIKAAETRIICPPAMFDR